MDFRGLTEDDIRYIHKHCPMPPIAMTQLLPEDCDLDPDQLLALDCLQRIAYWIDSTEAEDLAAFAMNGTSAQLEIFIEHYEGRLLGWVTNCKDQLSCQQHAEKYCDDEGVVSIFSRQVFENEAHFFLAGQDLKNYARMLGILESVRSVFDFPKGAWTAVNEVNEQYRKER